jgi:hypothetical protein
MVHKLPLDVPTDLMTLVKALSNAIRWVYEVGGVSLGKTVVIEGPRQRLTVARDTRARPIVDFSRSPLIHRPHEKLLAA